MFSAYGMGPISIEYCQYEKLEFQILTCDLQTLNNTLSISNSPRPLTAGPIRNAENMEFLLSMGHAYESYSMSRTV